MKYGPTPQVRYWLDYHALKNDTETIAEDFDVPESEVINAIAKFDNLKKRRAKVSSNHKNDLGVVTVFQCYMGHEYIRYEAVKGSDNKPCPICELIEAEKIKATNELKAVLDSIKCNENSTTKAVIDQVRKRLGYSILGTLKELGEL